MALHPFALESINILIEIRAVILGDVVVAIVVGVAIGILADGLCGTVLGMVLKPIMAVFGLGSQVEQIQVAIENGDSAEITVRVVQLLCMLFGLTSQCFTGDTLVATEDGLKPIEDVEAGELVWSEDTETGEKELRKVLAVSVTETVELVHVWVGEEEIRTTQNHPFYVEGQGWKAAGELVAGDVLRTESGNLASVRGVSVERLEEPVRVWNLEIESAHVYYVGVFYVLVHNQCELGENLDKYNGEEVGSTTTKKGDVKKDFIFDSMEDAKNYGREVLGLDAERMYDEFGKWIGWSGKNGEIYWGHGDWGKGLGKSTFPHLNFVIDSVKGHFFIKDKMINRGQWNEFINFFGL